MNVGFDIAPLLQTRAGTARWVGGLRRGLEERIEDPLAEPGPDVRFVHREKKIGPRAPRGSTRPGILHQSSTRASA